MSVSIANGVGMRKTALRMSDLLGHNHRVAGGADQNEETHRKVIDIINRGRSRKGDPDVN